MDNRGGGPQRQNEFIRLISRMPFWLALFAMILAWPKLLWLCDIYLRPYLVAEYGSELAILMFICAMVAVTLAVFFLTQATMTSSLVGFAVALADRFVI